MDMLPEARLQVDQEVEYFAKALDECLVARGSVNDQRSRLLKLVSTYHRYAHDRVAALRKRTFRHGHTRLRGRDLVDLDIPRGVSNDQAELERWELETQTWDLLRRLLPTRYPVSSATKTAVTLTDTKPLTRKEYWDRFLKSDPVAFERKTVLDWLQNAADEGPDMDDLAKELYANAERGDIIAHGWIHTRSSIKRAKRVHSQAHPLDLLDVPDINGQGLPIASQLDPDSITRQGRKLEQQDQYFEKAIWLGCFELLRRGKKTSEIVEWCRERTEGWRGVSIAALPLAKDEDDEIPDYDPSSVVLWRRMCFALARNGGSDEYERAVYGLLSGDISSVEKVCRTWDDMLFAHYNALLRAQFDTYLLSFCPKDVSTSICQSFPTFDARRLSLNIFSLGSRPGTLAKPGLSPIKALQASIIANTLGDFVFEQGIVLAKHANQTQRSKVLHDYGVSSSNLDPSKFMPPTDHDGLRVITHMHIITTALEKLSATGHPLLGSNIDTRRQVQDNTIAAYAALMRLACLDELIPLYCSRLDGDRVYEVLSRNLIQVVDRDDRVSLLGLMQKLDLDSERFIRFQSSLLLEDLECEGSESNQTSRPQFKILDSSVPSLRYGRQLQPDFFGDDPEMVDQPDELFIRSLEWLLLSRAGWREACTFGIHAYKYFLRHKRLNAARSLFNRVPCMALLGGNSGSMVDLGSYADGVPDFDIMIGDDVSVEDSSRANMVADARLFWELECLVRALDTMETVASLIGIAREPVAVKRELWDEVALNVNRTKEYAKPLFAGWLLGGSQEDRALEEVREEYLPETVMAYISILHFAGTSVSRDYLLECMELASVIAERESDLAALFVKCGRMKELLEAFASCSKALAVHSDEKKGTGSSCKKLRETGWSRELWSVRPDGA